MSAHDPEDPPNVLLIYTDDQPQEWVGCYGGNVLTPNIDSLAEDGLRFDRYYASSPVCSPSRYSALSGRYASRSAQFHETCPPGEPVNIGWEPGIPGDDANLASLLQDHGYHTGFCGKWHQGGVEGLEDNAQDADPTDPAVESTLQANYESLVETIQECGFDDVHSAYYGNVFARGPESVHYHNMEWITQGACDFLQSVGEQPFFLTVSPTLTHDPWEADQLEADQRITPTGLLEEPPSDVQPSRASVIERVREAEVTATPPSDAENAAFMSRSEIETGRRFATWLDDGIGAILGTLEEQGLAENTLVVFTSDHGNKGKFTCYDGGARQPCIVRWPGIVDAGTTDDRLVSNVDLAPTILDAAGITPPHEYTIDGQSFLAVLTGQGEYERSDLFLEITTERAVVTDDGLKYIAVRYPPDIAESVEAGDRYTHYCRELEPGEAARYDANEDYPAYFERDQLYDLDSDPAEQINLAGNPDYGDQLGALRDRLETYSESLPHSFGEFA